MEVRNKREWFHRLIADREQFFDAGFTAVYLDGEKNLALLFWKCVPEGDGPWLSFQEK